jgi:hypothetical protein
VQKNDGILAKSTDSGLLSDYNNKNLNFQMFKDRPRRGFSPLKIDLREIARNDNFIVIKN